MFIENSTKQEMYRYIKYICTNKYEGELSYKNYYHGNRVIEIYHNKNHKPIYACEIVIEISKNIKKNYALVKITKEKMMKIYTIYVWLKPYQIKQLW